MSKSLLPLTLSKSDINVLQKKYKQERDRRIAERIQCIILYAEGFGLKEIRRILVVGVKPFKKWVKTFLVDGLEGFRTWAYKGQACQMSAEQWAEVEKEFARVPYRRAKEVARFVNKQFGVAYSERGMQALLRRKGDWYIKTRLVPGKSDEDKQKEHRAWVQKYFALKARLGPKDRVYHVDATHPTHNIKITYVGTKKGLWRRQKSNTGRKRYNILGAYCPDDHEYLDIRGTDNVKATTRQALIDKIRAHHPKAERIVFILDHARYNHAKLVKEPIKDTAVELTHLPSYSPNLNLIERLWRFLKNEVMTAYHDAFEGFVKAIENVLDNLDEDADELTSLMTEKFEILTCA